MEIIKTICGMCGGDNCGIDVHVADGRIITIRGSAEHPVNRGKVCPQARAAIELAADPTRLQHPLRRVGDSWQRITWDEALDILADKLTALKATDGPQALAVYQGRALLQFMRDGWPQRFMNLYGSPNLVRNDHMCSYPCIVSEKLTYGQSTIYGPDSERTECMLLWGSNPATSHIPFFWQDALKMKRRGGKLIVIDPRRTAAAAQADIHVPLRPGTDAALALGLLNVIITEKLYDADFVARWTVGFEQLTARVAAYPPEVIAPITGVPPELTRAVARLYATTWPAYLDTGNALEHHSNSSQILRATMILRALTGNLDVPGGHVLRGPTPLADVTLREMRPASPPLGKERYPIFLEYAGFVPGDSLLDAILDGEPYPIKALILAGGNPSLTWPNTARVNAALRKVDFLAVMELHMTATAQHADLVLPAAYSLEKTQFVMRAGPYGADKPPYYAMLTKQAVPAGERRTDWWLWAELGRRLGYSAYYPWPDERAAIDHLIAPLGINVADLEANPGGLYVGQPHTYRGYLDRGFHTPSGKVELYSSVLEATGYDPLPGYTEPNESPVSDPALAERFPLVLNAGRRVAVYTHARHRGLPSLRRADPEPLAEIHPRTAARYGVSDGDWVEVASLRGSIRLKAHVIEDIWPDVVSLLHGWEEANANVLTDERHCDPVLSCPPLRAGLCNIKRVG